MRLPVVSGKEVIRALLKQGFTVRRSKGSHIHLIKPSFGKVLHVTVPVHANEDLNPFVLRSIIRQTGYSAEEFANLF